MMGLSMRQGPLDTPQKLDVHHAMTYFTLKIATIFAGQHKH